MSVESSFSQARCHNFEDVFAKIDAFEKKCPLSKPAHDFLLLSTLSQVANGEEIKSLKKPGRLTLFLWNRYSNVDFVRKNLLGIDVRNIREFTQSVRAASNDAKLQSDATCVIQAIRGLRKPKEILKAEKVELKLLQLVQQETRAPQGQKSEGHAKISKCLRKLFEVEDEDETVEFIKRAFTKKELETLAVDLLFVAANSGRERIVNLIAAQMSPSNQVRLTNRMKADVRFASVDKSRLADLQPDTIQQRANRDQKHTILFNSMFDKVEVANKRIHQALNKFAGIRVSLGTFAFTNALEKIVSHDTLSKETKATLSHLGSLCAKSEVLESPEAIVRAIRSLSENPPHNKVVIDVGSKDHQTLILVTKTSKKEYQVTYYNTGDGIHHHYKDEKSGKVQTHLTYEHVPTTSLLSVKGWEKMKGAEKSSDINDSYAALAELAYGGSKRAREQNPALYEPQQERGTCTIMVLLALMRHQILTQDGSFDDNLVQYKLVKGFFREAIWKNLQFEANAGKVDKMMVQLAAEKMASSGRYYQFALIANDKKSYEAAINCYANALGIDAPPMQKRPTERIMTLNRLYTQLVDKWLHEKMRPTPSDPYLNMAAVETIRIRKLKNEIRKEIAKSLRRAPSDFALIQRQIRILLRYGFYDEAYSAIRSVCKSRHPQLLYSEFLPPLLYELQRKGQNLLVKRIDKHVPRHSRPLVKEALDCLIQQEISKRALF